jgi:hypothetical protein
MRSRRPFLLLACAIAVVLLVSLAAAQNRQSPGNNQTTFHGVPASVTSFGFGGSRGFHGVPASVTSPNFGNSAGFNGSRHPHFGTVEGRRHHHVQRGYVNPFYGSAYYAPYIYPGYVMEPGPDDSMESDYDSPAMSDRNGPDPQEAVRHELNSLRSTVNDYREELLSDRDKAKEKKEPEAQREPEEPAVSQPPTVLVFKDGHQVQVVNYAIVGSTLYDLSDGRTKKVALAALDVPATVKQNDDRGVDFKVPEGVKLN